MCRIRYKTGICILLIYCHTLSMKNCNNVFLKGDFGMELSESSRDAPGIGFLVFVV